jgi:Zn-dependent protease
MWRTYRVGRLLGFPIEVNPSFLLLLGLVLMFSGGLTGLYVVLLGFASVLLHELGHAVVARRLGVRIAGIELRFFGGAAKMIDAPRTPGDEIAIAAAGPAVSFVLSGLAFGLALASGLEVFHLLCWINLIIGLFNLTPALPMDGGRILRGLLAMRMSFTRATDIAIKVSRGFAVLFGVMGVLTARPYLVMLAVMLWWMGTAERAAVLGAPGRWVLVTHGRERT